MRKRLIITLVLCIVMTLVLAVSVSAECQTHTNKWTVTLGSEGFLGTIQAKGECSECGAVTNETIPALFITRGYSYTENGGIAQGYGVNRDAIARYEEITKEKVQFGGVLALRSKIGEYNPLDINLNPLDKSVQKQDFTDSKYSIINIMVQGIPADKYEDTQIICALYVSAGGRITYIDNRAEKVNCGDKSFNEVKAAPAPDKTQVDKHTIIDGTRYHQLTADELQLTQGMFWNNSSLQSSNNATFNSKFWATGVKFDKTSLPVGSIIYVDGTNNWQYRPHKWSGTRPDNTKKEYVTVDDAWWGNFTYVGFNISKYDKSSGWSNTVDDMTVISGYTKEQISEIFKIYIPYSKYGNPEITEPDTPSEPEIPTPDQPLTDYSAQKQDWDEDGVLKILAIGNSFSVDSMEYIYQVAQSAGIENVVLGNLYIGGCSLQTHLSNAQNNSGSYTYYTNSTGKWSSKGGVSIKTAMESDDWDFVSIQQVSGQSGVSDSYSILNDLIRIVEPLNPSARLVWHMTWAYQSNSSHSDFGKYDRNQMTMYNAIVSAVKTNIVPNDHIEIIIPAGTAVQNVRTSYVGDTLTRDGYHLSLDYGRFIGSLTFVKALTGVSIDNVKYTPNGVDADKLAVAIEAVNNAYAKPFEVTKSTYTTAPGGSGSEGGNSGSEGGENEGGSGDDSGSGEGTVDSIFNTGSTVTPPEVPEGYIWLTADQMGLIEDAYYQSDASSGYNSPKYAENDFGRGFVTTKKFTREELPIGSIIVIADGWQYRPEGWINGSKNSSSSRPVNVTTQTVVITKEWWGSWTERAFNVSKVGNTVNSAVPITDQEKIDFTNAVFFIYVPEDPSSFVPEENTTVYVNSSDCDEEIVTIDGKQYRALSIDAMGYMKKAYYYSSQKGPEIYSNTDGTSDAFWATGVFTKADLPIGAILWVNSGWQYRPEGWISGKGGSRPGNVKTTYVTMDETWWSNWTERAFNISKTNGAKIGTDANVTAETIHENFKIYIPIENIK